MIIKRSQYAAKGVVITDDSTDKAEHICADLSVGSTYLEAGTSKYITFPDKVSLKSGSCIVVETKERLRLSKSVFGFVCSKGSLSCRGMMVPNTKVDPLFNGKLNIAIYNSGQTVLDIKKGDKFCSVVFQWVDGDIESDSARSVPVVSYFKSDWCKDFIRNNSVLLVTSVATIIISVLGAYFAVIAAK